MNYPTCDGNRFDGLKFLSNPTQGDLASCLWWWRRLRLTDYETENAAWWGARGIVTHGVDQQWRLAVEPSAFFYEFAVRDGLIAYRGRWTDLGRENQSMLYFVHGVASNSLNVEHSRAIIKSDLNAPREELARLVIEGKLETKSPRKKTAPWHLIEAMDEDSFKVKCGGLSDSERSQKSKVRRDVVSLIARAESEGIASILF